MRVTGRNAERIIALREQASRDRAAAAAERAAAKAEEQRAHQLMSQATADWSAAQADRELAAGLVRRRAAGRDRTTGWPRPR